MLRLLSRSQARQLGHERERLERGIATVLQLLEGVGESAPLVDPEGFPRSDIDVHGVRHARAELAKLRFDLGKVNGRLVTALHAAHAEARGNGDEVVETISTPGASKKHERVPFASFDEVTAVRELAASGSDATAAAAAITFPHCICRSVWAGGPAMACD